MNEKYYTPDGHHPEDAIFKAKTFINELQNVQEEYFRNLANDLKLTKEGEDWLFDYVYNTTEDEKYDGFEHYLEDFKKKYNDMVYPDVMYTNSAETLLSTDFGEFSPMMHMSSYEPDLETAFPPAYNGNEPVSLGLDAMIVDIKNDKSNNQI